jgi:iron complex outermembrane recepter protein
LNLSLLINNIFNHEYESNGYTYSYLYEGKITENFVFPQAGVNFLAGMRLRF